MRRNLAALANQTFDVLVIGGGIHGACVAWEATLRGLSVALVEQSDFASGTSANSLKVIHGGLRYLQTADLQRMRQSIKERQTLMRIAPHLVHPMPVLVPTYGHGIKGKEAMTVALKMNDVISGDRNRPLSDPQKHIPTGKLLSKTDCLAQLPDLESKGLTGAACFHDAQMHNSEQLVLAFIQSAAEQGAQIANYLKVTAVHTKDSKVVGATVQDQRHPSAQQQSAQQQSAQNQSAQPDTFTIQANTIINASGPWIDQLIATATGQPTTTHKRPLAKAMNLVTRPLFDTKNPYAVGITGRAPGSRLFFIAPWRGKSLVGTWYGPDNEGTKPPTATSDEVANFLDQINRAYPTFQLTPDDVEWVHSGLLPSDGQSSETGDMKLTKRFQLIDHKADGLQGLLSIKGVKYTTARDLARRAIDWVFNRRQQMPETSTSDKTPIHGGDIEQFDTFLANAIQTSQLPADTVTRLVYNYGSAYTDVLACMEPGVDGSTDDREKNLKAIAAEVKYSLDNTMAQTLSDVIFRRTELGAAGHPGADVLQHCANIMSDHLGWSLSQRTAEVETVEQQFTARSFPQKPSSPPPEPLTQTRYATAVSP
ncbi:MAG: FAD-dependent oxidoreductase [Phormidesmis sp.]